MCGFLSGDELTSKSHACCISGLVRHQHT